MAEIKDIYGLNYTSIHDVYDDIEVKEDIVLEEVIIPENGEIRGIIKDKDGNPVPDATVKIFDDNNNPIMHTKSTVDGKYVIYGVPYGSYKIGVYAKGCAAQSQKSTTVSKDVNPTVDFVCDKSDYLKLGFIAGIIFQSGTKKTISQARVQIKKKSDGTLMQETITAQDGEYLITGMPDGDYIVTCMKNGFTVEDVSEITIVNGGIYSINLFMFPLSTQNIRGTFNGCVRDKQGNPLSNVPVALYIVSDDEDKEERIVDMQTTDAFGKYFFGDVQGKCKVKAIKDTSL